MIFSIFTRSPVILMVQTLALFIVGLVAFLIVGIRGASFIECTGWVSCGSSAFPSINNQVQLIEWMQHISVILLPAVWLPNAVFALVAYRREDLVIANGLRLAAFLFAVQALISAASYFLRIAWQAHAFHTLSMVLMLLLVGLIVGWTLFFASYDYPTTVFAGMLLLTSLLPVLYYLWRFNLISA